MVQPGLEHSPAQEAVPVARAFNDWVAEAIAARPDRFAGLAALPTANPKAAAEELARAVNELAFEGALVNGRTQERFLDDEFFWPMFESAEALGVPIYLHPVPPPKAVYDAYYSGYGDDVRFMLAAPAWAGTSRPGCTPCA
jgi:predicted TIM-barrel fold metal-dependent hydrolase